MDILEMKREQILQIIKSEKLIGIIRLKKQGQVDAVVKGLASSGMRVLEITSNTPGFLDEIKRARKLYPKTLIGAGTITDTQLAISAIKYGAQFLVSPNTNLELIKIAHQNDIPIVMGALTPTEIHAAYQNGADIIKLFPAETLGIDYFKAIKGPLADVDFFVVGGIDLNNIHEWMTAGVKGFGIGGVLTNFIDGRDGMESMKKMAKEFLQQVKKS